MVVTSFAIAQTPIPKMVASMSRFHVSAVVACRSLGLALGAALSFAPSPAFAQSLSPEQRAQLTNIPKASKPAIPKTQEECVGENRFWTEQGPSRGVKSCALRATDAHKICTDGSQCEGECLAAENLADAKPAVGSCSEWVMNFGCHKFIADKVVHQVCVD